jgi:DNA-binding transcriptional MerR regulator
VGEISRIIALKELGLSLAQVRRLLDGVTLGELRGMLLLRRAQFEHEVDQHTNQLLGVEARLSSIAKEDGMPDDIVAKTIPFDQLGIHDRVKEAGPRIIFYEREHGEDVTVFLALPVTEPPAELPAPALYRVLPEVEAAVAVRRARQRASSRWSTRIWAGGSRSMATTSTARAVKCVGPRQRDRTDPGPQVFKIQLPFTRFAATDENSTPPYHLADGQEPAAAAGRSCASRSDPRHLLRLESRDH